AGVEHLELAVALAKQVGGAVEDAAALGPSHGGPDRETLRRRGDGALDIGLSGALYAADLAPVCRVDRGEGGVARCRDTATVDEERLERQHGLAPLRARLRDLAAQIGAGDGARPLAVERAVERRAQP